MKTLLVVFIISLLLPLTAFSGTYISVMADDVTGEVVPPSLEARMEAVDIGSLADDVEDLQENYSLLVASLGGFLTSSNAALLYQPIGSYQPAGDYLIPSDIIGYLTEANAALTYQPLGAYLTTANLVNLSNNLATATSKANGASNSVEALSNIWKRADMEPCRVTIANDAVSLSITTNYYVVSVNAKLTNWVLEAPSGKGAIYLVDIDYDGVSTLAWGGSLINCTNLPVPPPTGKSSYVFQWICDSTNFIGY